MDINKFYEEWNNLSIDNYRKDIIVNLYKKKLSSKGFIQLLFSDNINTYLKKFLKNKNKTIDNLTNFDMHKIIVDLNSSIKLNKKQLELIKHYFPDKKIMNEYLKKNSQKYIDSSFNKNYSDLRLIDYNLLINENPDVNFEKCLQKVHKIREYIIDYNPDYEYGYQITDKFEDYKMYYLKFYDMLMIDYDNKNIDELHKLLDKYDFSYKIYETRNGYHVYITSHKISYNDKLSTEIMLSFNCDKRYIIFSKYNGYNIRLSKKNNEDSFYYKFIEDYGKGIPNKELLLLTGVLEKFTGKK